MIKCNIRIKLNMLNELYEKLPCYIGAKIINKISAEKKITYQLQFLEEN